jgi:lysophospholipase L1-like esterase
MRDLPLRDVVASPALNFSIGGDTTKGLLGRVPRYSRLGAARRIVVGIGINDLSHSDDDVLLGHYRALVAYLAALGPKVTITAILPINEETYRQANATLLSGQKVTNGRIAAVNQAIRELCAGRPNVEFVDVNGAVAPGGNLLGEYTDDGLHLNRLGTSVWAAALRERLEPR